jgi:hypothetical protein
MSRVGLLNRVDCQHARGIGQQAVNVVECAFDHGRPP